MDHHFQVGAKGEFDGFNDKYFTGRRPNGIYIPRFRNLGGSTNQKDFIRGYGYQGGGARGSWTENVKEMAYGPEFKEAILKWENERLPEFIKVSKGINISKKAHYKPQYWETLFISGGRKDKISKGDIAGLFFKKGGLSKDQLGTIELKPDCAFVAIPLELANGLVEKLNNTRLKKKKVRVIIL